MEANGDFCRIHVYFYVTMCFIPATNYFVAGLVFTWKLSTYFKDKLRKRGTLLLLRGCIVSSYNILFHNLSFTIHTCMYIYLCMYKNGLY